MAERYPYAIQHQIPCTENGCHTFIFESEKKKPYAIEKIEVKNLMQQNTDRQVKYNHSCTSTNTLLRISIKLWNVPVLRMYIQ